jgi:roadblock/LC7 domain-containing protein
MKRILLTALGIFALLQLNAQKSSDSTGFKSRKLKIEEINLVSSYYAQDGNNSAITGGIGTEKLNNISNVIDVKLVKYDKKLRKHIINAEMGVDYYTSASSDMIDLKANSSASHADARFYPSVNWTLENENKRKSFVLGLSSSVESDYLSFGLNVGFTKKNRNRSGEFTAKLQAFFDRLKLVDPIELRAISNGRYEDYLHAARNSFTLSVSWSQVVNERLQVMFLADLAVQQGYLSLPFHRVYLLDSTVRQEKLPGNRFKIPLGFRANYFLGDRFIIKTYYRYYLDDWGLQSHTINVELPVKITPFISVSPFYRCYDQNGISSFAPYRKHTATDHYYSSNYNLAAFNSNFFGMGIQLKPIKGVFGMQRFNMLELRYGHYTKNIGMNADIISLNARFN